MEYKLGMISDIDGHTTFYMQKYARAKLVFFKRLRQVNWQMVDKEVNWSDSMMQMYVSRGQSTTD